MKLRIGQGYDVHRLASGRKMVIGGVEIPSDMGIVGHSDADVLLHAICDAMLGALALGDIGKHFPDTDPSYKGISSLRLLAHVHELIRSKNYEIINIDSTVILEKPKIGPHVQKMRQAISEILGLDINSISIKATTSEGMGFVGHEEGIAAQAVVLLREG